MSRWKWLVLIFELALFALILVLPQVDLPEFAFHGGTAPVVTKARLSSTPIRSAIIVVAAETPLPAPAVEIQVENRALSVPAVPDSRLSLLCTLLC
jgi:hypothetical protein